MIKKYLVFKELDGIRYYKRTKTLDFWTKDKAVCWKYSKQGARQIAARYNLNSDNYIYGVEEV